MHLLKLLAVSLKEGNVSTFIEMIKTQPFPYPDPWLAVEPCPKQTNKQTKSFLSQTNSLLHKKFKRSWVLGNMPLKKLKT